MKYMLEFPSTIRLRSVLRGPSTLKSAIQHAPIAISLMLGPLKVFEIVDDAWKDLVSARAYTGRPHADVYPELVGTEAEKSLTTVYETGESCVSTEVELRVQTSEGIFQERCYDYSIQCLRQANGTNWGC